MKTTRICSLNGINYTPVPPQADNDDLAAQGRRLILRHGSATQPKSEIIVAQVNELTAGWVIGLIV